MFSLKLDYHTIYILQIDISRMKYFNYNISEGGGLYFQNWLNGPKLGQQFWKVELQILILRLYFLA